jgi:hypothetical protein
MYVAVVGEDGHVRVREAEPRVRDLYGPPRERRPSGGVSTGQVLGTVEIQFSSHHGQDVAAMLAGRVRDDLRDAGITRAIGWLPEKVVIRTVATSCVRSVRFTNALAGATPC